MVRVDFSSGIRCYMIEVVEVPCLADRKGSVCVLLGLVHAYTARLSNCNNDNTGLLGLRGSRFGRRGTRGIGRVLCYSDMGNVGFEHLSGLLAPLAQKNKELDPGLRLETRQARVEQCKQTGKLELT